MSSESLTNETVPRTPEQWLQSLKSDPGSYCHSLDLTQLRFLLLHLDESAFHESAFLDDRIIKRDTAGIWLPLDQLQASSATPPTTGLICHVGHCGSTLLSKLLSASGDLRGYREPQALLALAHDRRDQLKRISMLHPDRHNQLVGDLAQLYSKHSVDQQGALVKASSVAANLLKPWLELSPESSAIMLFLPLDEFLAVMLRAQSTRASVRANARLWQADLLEHTSYSTPLYQLNDPELAALCWLGAMRCFAEAKKSADARVLGLTLDQLLHAPHPVLEKCLQHLGHSVDSASVDDAVQSGLMTRYAKDPEQPFSPAVRQQEIAKSKQQFAGEIVQGMAWASDKLTALDLDELTEHLRAS